MEFEDGLLIGVVLVIAANRVFTDTGVKHSRAVYVFVQAFDVGACIALFFSTMFPDPRLDYAVRGFLMLFVAFHMVKNSALRAALARAEQAPDDEDEIEVMRREIQEEIRAEREEERRRLEEAEG